MLMAAFSTLMKEVRYMDITKVWYWIRVAVAAVCGALGWFFGEANGLLYALIVLTVLDFLIGLLRNAVVDRNVSSAALFKRALQKSLIFILVGVAHVIDEYVLKQGAVLRNIVIFFYISSEGVSILEHVAALGLPIPEKLLSALRDIHAEDTTRDTTVHDTKKKGAGS